MNRDDESRPAADDGAQPSDRGLPDAPLFGLLRVIEVEVGIERIDRVWILPPRKLDAGETAVVVVAAYPESGTDRRRVFAAHYTAPADETGARLALDEFGTAPADRVGRLVEDAVDRLKDEPATPPRTARIEGDAGRWYHLVHDLAQQHLHDVVARQGKHHHPRALVDDPGRKSASGGTRSD